MKITQESMVEAVQLWLDGQVKVVKDRVVKVYKARDSYDPELFMIELEEIVEEAP